jgi:hypothetical protein
VGEFSFTTNFQKSLLPIKENSYISPKNFEKNQESICDKFLPDDKIKDHNKEHKKYLL